MSKHRKDAIVGVEAPEFERTKRGKKLVSDLVRAVKAVQAASDSEANATAMAKEADLRAQLVVFNAELRPAPAPAEVEVQIAVRCPTCGAEFANAPRGVLVPHYRAGREELCPQTLRRFKGAVESRSPSVRTVSGGLPGSGRRA
jgi:hypothetical protein